MRLMNIALIIVSLFATQHAIAGPQAEFQDWRVICDDYQNCAASTAADADPLDGFIPDYKLSIARDAYKTYWEIAVTAYASQPNPDTPLTFSVDGAETMFSAPTEIAAFGALNDYFLLGTSAQELMDKLVPGTNAKIMFEGTNSATQDIDFSLSGLAAALLWIDEHQTRIGSERVVGPPEDKKPLLDRTPAPMPEELLKLRSTNTDCLPLNELPIADDVQSHRLSATHTLHLLPCWAGAYNFGYLVFVDDGYQTSQQHFATYSDTLGWNGTPTVVNPYFDQATGILWDFYKGRGLGDCGTSGTWIWAEWGFKLINFDAKPTCDGPDDDGSVEFPTIYRAPDFAFASGY